MLAINLAAPKGAISLPILIVALMLAAVLPGRVAVAQESDLFFVKPYLQLGDHAKLSPSESEKLLWLSAAKSSWTVEERVEGSQKWTDLKGKIQHHQLPSTDHSGLEVYACELTGLKPGKKFDYRVKADNKEVFSASSTARKGVDAPLHIVLHLELAGLQHLSQLGMSRICLGHGCFPCAAASPNTGSRVCAVLNRSRLGIRVIYAHRGHTWTHARWTHRRRGLGITAS